MIFWRSSSSCSSNSLKSFSVSRGAGRARGGSATTRAGVTGRGRTATGGRGRSTARARDSGGRTPSGRTAGSGPRRATASRGLPLGSTFATGLAAATAGLPLSFGAGLGLATARTGLAGAAFFFTIARGRAAVLFWVAILFLPPLGPTRPASLLHPAQAAHHLCDQAHEPGGRLGGRGQNLRNVHGLEPIRQAGVRHH